MSYNRLQLSYTNWTRVLGTDVEIRLTPDAQGVEYRTKPKDPVFPSWWPPRRGDVFENTSTGTRYCDTARGIMGIDSGKVFPLTDFAHPFSGEPLWRLLVPAFNRAGDERRADGL